MVISLYYSSVTKRNGSWQSSEGYILSDTKEKLAQKISTLPIHEPNTSWEYSVIESFATTKEKIELFIKNATEGILWVGDFEMKKYK